MIHKLSKKTILLLFVFLLLTLVFLLRYVRLNQNNINKASTATSLYFEPDTTSDSPLMKNIGDKFEVKLMINPGNSLVSFIKLAIRYDPAILTLENTDAISLNNRDFPVILEGPYINNGKIDAIVSTGSDPTRAVDETTVVATITFTALSGTGDRPIAVDHDKSSLALSVGANESASQNVLQLTTPFYVLVNGDRAISPTTTISPTPELSINPKNTVLNVNLFLHGIGNSGDNPNPANHAHSNKNPKHKSRIAIIELINSRNEYIATKESNLLYTSQSGNFRGQVDLGPHIHPGNYIIKIKANQFLRNSFPGIQQITSKPEIDMPVMTLVSGDVLSDNKLNILDYNILYGCYKTDLFPVPRNCTPANALQSDLTDEGDVNYYDINLFVRELSVQTGL